MVVLDPRGHHKAYQVVVVDLYAAACATYVLCVWSRQSLCQLPLHLSNIVAWTPPGSVQRLIKPRWKLDSGRRMRV